MKLNNPHDAAVKSLFDNNERIIEIMQISLPKVILDYLDTSTLKRESSSFVDENLKEYHSDLF